MARDCLHPVMLYSHVGTHTLSSAVSFVCVALVSADPLALPQTSPLLENRPLVASSPQAETLCCCLFYTLVSLQMCVVC